MPHLCVLVSVTEVGPIAGWFLWRDSSSNEAICLDSKQEMAARLLL